MSEEYPTEFPGWLRETPCLKKGHDWEHFSSETMAHSLVMRTHGATNDLIMWQDSKYGVGAEGGIGLAPAQGFVHPKIMWEHRKCKQCGKHQITVNAWNGAWLTVDADDG